MQQRLCSSLIDHEKTPRQNLEEVGWFNNYGPYLTREQRACPRSLIRVLFRSAQPMRLLYPCPQEDQIYPRWSRGYSEQSRGPPRGFMELQGCDMNNKHPLRVCCRRRALVSTESAAGLSAIWIGYCERAHRLSAPL